MDWSNIALVGSGNNPLLTQPYDVAYGSAVRPGYLQSLRPPTPRYSTPFYGVVGAQLQHAVGYPQHFLPLSPAATPAGPGPQHQDALVRQLSEERTARKRAEVSEESLIMRLQEEHDARLRAIQERDSLVQQLHDQHKDRPGAVLATREPSAGAKPLKNERRLPVATVPREKQSKTPLPGAGPSNVPSNAPLPAGAHARIAALEELVSSLQYTEQSLRNQLRESDAIVGRQEREIAELRRKNEELQWLLDEMKGRRSSSPRRKQARRDGPGGGRHAGGTTGAWGSVISDKALGEANSGERGTGRAQADNERVREEGERAGAEAEQEMVAEGDLGEGEGEKEMDRKITVCLPSLTFSRSTVLVQAKCAQPYVDFRFHFVLDLPPRLHGILRLKKAVQRRVQEELQGGIANRVQMDRDYERVKER